MGSPLRRWRGFGKPKRAELYFRWSIYLMPLIVLPVALLGLAAQTGQYPVGSARVILAVSLATTLVGIRACRTSLDHYLGRPTDHHRWLLANGAVTVVGAWALLLTGPAIDGPTAPPPTLLLTTGLLVVAFAPLSIGLPLRWSAPAAVVLALVVAPAMMLAGMSVGSTAGQLVGTVLGMPFVAASCRSFAWLTAVVWELDGARETQSRLAVAEERLRFSRDLHDVMGRNLTTIALKSELAVQLARRGRPEAAEQMAEVQKIAQESQREVREVIRGYRTADLHAEAIGARAVLRSADVACEIDLGEHADELPPPVQSVFGWVIREATTNVLRHSEAGRCLIRLRREDGRAVLELENDGVPAVPLPSQGGGTGLRGLRERLAAHDGELTVPPAAAGTFRMLATVPLPDHADRTDQAGHADQADRTDQADRAARAT
ncbi:histidine kinase [Kitasatospora xanthocidica]|uniref:sensor histidine kinase n=1 Tax=Kitasatospora xanthocidica TaxID=83382 RepID=UPI0016762DC4|nr:histidine kinase [Kitasatospora xanthocidica]GHF29183.1 histidine kinase [Kitasatospora xanthocidica]